MDVLIVLVHNRNSSYEDYTVKNGVRWEPSHFAHFFLVKLTLGV